MSTTLIIERPRTEASEAPVAIAPPPPSPRKANHRLLLWTVPLLLAPCMYLSVQALSRTERALAVQVPRSRVVTYALEPRGRLKFPIEPNTDVLRFGVRAFARSALSPSPHPIRMVFEARGAARARTESVEVPLSGLEEHATAEDPALSVGDSSPINIDVRDIGAGELTLTLDSVGEADGVLVRAHRREVDARGGVLWSKLAPLSDDTHGLTPRTLAVARSQPIPSQLVRGTLGTFAVSGDERVAGTARGPNTIVARAASSADAVVTMVLRSSVHGEQMIAGVGQVVAELASEEQADFEVASEADEPIALDAADGGSVSLGRSLRYFRSADDRPVLLDAGAEPLVLQVHARRPVARASDAPVDIALVSTITPRSRRPANTLLLCATRERSRFDRYQDSSGELAPSEAAVFHLLVPAHSRLALQPREGELDLSLSELDPRASEQPQDEIADPFARKLGFETRWPSNVADFDANTGLVFVSPKLVIGAEPPAPQFAMAYVKRPPRALAMERGGKWFVRADRPIDVRVSGKRPLVLPIRLFAERASNEPVRIEIDGGHPRRRSLASVQRVTTNRSVMLDGMIKTYVMLGDDLVAGRHRLAFVTDSNTVVWVQLPWMQPHAPRWISGSFGL
jgi:hypothetical protein